MLHRFSNFWYHKGQNPTQRARKASKLFSQKIIVTKLVDIGALENANLFTNNETSRLRNITFSSQLQTKTDSIYNKNAVRAEFYKGILFRAQFSKIPAVLGPSGDITVGDASDFIFL